ncbi:MAG: ChaN family lipoprotein [Planctomycetes bacterium]|nr:ChaN family lipoprotein [Planctomycetota bacterium]
MTRPALSAARREFIDLQRDLARRIKAEIQDSIGKTGAELERYQREYHRGLARSWTPSDLDALRAALRGADVIYCGDYHTLPQAQKTALRLLEEVSGRRPVTLALEVVYDRDQGALDRYMAGELPEADFLAAIDYERTWGFPWVQYRPLFEWALREGARVVGINSDPAGKRGHLKRRDRVAAEVLAREVIERPERRLFVLDGDLHVAREHLPALVRASLRRRRRAGRFVVVFQNSEAIYWELAEQGLEQTVDVVRLDEETWCVLSATPMVKLGSYLIWQENDEELHPRVREAWRRDPEDRYDYPDQFHGFVRAIAAFLDIRETLDTFTVFTAEDLEFLDWLRHQRGFSEREVADVKAQVERAESYFIPRGHVVYLGNLSVNHAAEEAAHYVNTVCAGHKEGPLSRQVDFYYRAMKEALGYFGSKVINHKRACTSVAGFEGFLREVARRRHRDSQEALMVRVARAVLRHKAMEAAVLAGAPARRSLRSVYELDPGAYGGAAHALGYILGDALYAAVMDGSVEREEVRRLYYEPFEAEGSEFVAYMDWARRLASRSTRTLPRRSV